MDTEVTVELRGKNLLFAVPTFDGNMPAEWMMAYMVTAQELGAVGVGCGLNVRSGSSLIPKCRDEIIHQFLFNEEMQPFDYMLCIDADVIWNPADILPMLAASIANSDETIFGTYPVKQDKPLFHIEFSKLDNKPIINGDLFRVNSGAAGFMLLSRTTLKRMYDRYVRDLGYTASPGSDFNADEKVCAMFTPAIVRDRYRGEDIMFCIRLGEAGHRMWLDPRIQLTHVGTKQYRHSFKEYLDNVVFAPQD